MRGSLAREIGHAATRALKKLPKSKQTQGAWKRIKRALKKGKYRTRIIPAYVTSAGEIKAEIRAKRKAREEAEKNA